jgi:hypothetical protein
VKAVPHKASPNYVRLTISPFFVAHALRCTPITDRYVILDLLAAYDSALALSGLKDPVSALQSRLMLN